MMDIEMPDTYPTTQSARTDGLRALKKAIAGGTCVLFLAASAFPAYACISTSQRIMRNHVVATPGKPVQLVVLDLLSVSLPEGSAEGWRVEDASGDNTLLRQLTQEQVASASQSQRFFTFRSSKSVVEPDGKPVHQLHFGAVGIGSGKLMLVNDLRKPRVSYVLDVEVGARQWPGAPARGSVHKADENRQGKAIGLGYYDTLEITLLGTIAEEWEIDAKGAGLALKEKRAASADTVMLMFRPTSTSSQSAVLKLSNGTGKNYSFQIQHQPTPLC